jgi:hypothetical protein
VVWLSGKLYGTSLHPLVWHKWPYPTVGRPIGSGAGEATKPSNSLISETVAALTEGPVHCRGVRGDARAVVRRVDRASVEKYIMLMSMRLNYNSIATKQHFGQVYIPFPSLQANERPVICQVAFPFHHPITSFPNKQVGVSRSTHPLSLIVDLGVRVTLLCTHRTNQTCYK